MSVTITGSVELHNAKVWRSPRLRQPLYKCDEFDNWLHIPKSVIDPKDFSAITREQRQNGKNSAALTIRVLRYWYEQTLIAIKAHNTGGVPVSSPGIKRVITRERRVFPTKTSARLRAFGPLSINYFK